MTGVAGPTEPRGIPLFWKLMLPVIAMVLVVGPAVTFVAVRDVASQARAEIDQDLLTASLDVRARLQERELRLLEAGSLAANLQGMAEAVAERDADRALELLRSVVALRPDLHAVTVLATDGHLLASIVEGTPTDAERGVAGLVGTGHRGALLSSGSQTTLAITTPVCGATGPCSSVGHVVVEVAVAELVSAVSSASSGRVAVALHGLDGEVIGAEAAARTVPRVAPGGALLRRELGTEDGPAAVATAPWAVQDRQVGAVSVVVPTADATAFAAATARRLALVLLLAMVGVVALAALVARSVLRQVRDLLTTSRALGRGDLDARAPVIARDEVGELASVLNAMADELRASHEHLERRVQERTAEVERLLRERTDFFAALSHELRTPLAVILHQARMRLDPAYGRGSSGTTAWEAVAETGEQLLETVNVILELARAESGRLDLQVEPVDVDAACRAVVQAMGPLATAARVDVQVVGEPTFALALADHQRLQQIIRNIVDNAIKYTPSGGRVDVVIESDLDRVCIAVTDDGPGVPEDLGDRVYEPFFRVPGTTPERGAPSTGLGLAMTRSLVLAQGGALSYGPAAGRGTRFTIRLPAVDVEDQPTPTPPTKRNTRATASRNASADSDVVGVGAGRTTARP